MACSSEFKTDSIEQTTASHKAHDLIEVEEGFNKIVNKLKYVDKQIDQEFNNSSINLENLNVAKFVGPINNAMALKEIESQEEELLKAVKTYKDKLLTDLKQTSSSLFLSFGEDSKQIEKTRERLMEQKKKVNEVIQSKDILEVFAASKDLENISVPKVEDILVAGSSEGAPKLVVMNPTAEVKKEYKFDNKKETAVFKSDLYHIGGIGRVLIIGQDNNTVSVYTGHPAFKVQGIEFKPYDIVSTASDNFVALDKQNKSLHILNNEGLAIIAFLTSQLITESPDALCISDTSHLYIACHAQYCKPSIYSVDISGW
ncbi:unnamed protein product [Mytilus edulis]|uniref:Uncharacterized protein n=1 Tax=Mytilus edulis TaxID=6550 RepID=A0A8S3V3I6_MYTED|nr:unnamed protein product [Mytilus edulis]